VLNKTAVPDLHRLFFGKRLSLLLVLQGFIRQSRRALSLPGHRLLSLELCFLKLDSLLVDSKVLRGEALLPLDVEEWEVNEAELKDRTADGRIELGEAAIAEMYGVDDELQREELEI